MPKYKPQLWLTNIMAITGGMIHQFLNKMDSNGTKKILRIWFNPQHTMGKRIIHWVSVSVSMARKSSKRMCLILLPHSFKAFFEIRFVHPILRALDAIFFCGNGIDRLFDFKVFAKRGPSNLSLNDFTLFEGSKRSNAFVLFHTRNINALSLNCQWLIIKTDGYFS